MAKFIRRGNCVAKPPQLGKGFFSDLPKQVQGFILENIQGFKRREAVEAEASGGYISTGPAW